MSLLEEAIAAHGGREAWESAAAVTARLHTGGLALAMKGAGERFESYEARVSMTEPRTVITPYDGGRGVFEGDSVRLETPDGELVERRDDMRRRFPGVRRRIRWDALDALYFGGYALWNYFTTPLFLTQARCREDGRRIHATFPDGVPTHSRRQTFQLRRRRAAHPARLHRRGVRQVGAAPSTSAPGTASSTGSSSPPAGA